MKWVALVIVVCLAAYTFLTLHYRKTVPSYRPYEDTKNRAGVMRLLSAGFQRVVLTAQRPADPGTRSGGAAAVAVSGGLDSDLASSLLETPSLPAEITHVVAGASTSALLAYPVQFTCNLPDAKRQLAGAELYIRDNAIILVPTFEELDGALLARSRESVVSVTIPPGTIRPGSYRVTITGERTSRSWPLQVH